MQKTMILSICAADPDLGAWDRKVEGGGGSKDKLKVSTNKINYNPSSITVTINLCSLINV